MALGACFARDSHYIRLCLSNMFFIFLTCILDESGSKSITVASQLDFLVLTVFRFSRETYILFLLLNLMKIH